jgi:hypothetical protein
MESMRLFNEYSKKMWESGRKEFGECPFCEGIVTRRDVGDNEIALILSSDPKVYHRECCPCQTDEASMKGKYQELDVRFENEHEVSAGQLSYEYVGMLIRCPYCFRVFDDNGKEVKL